MAIQSSCSAARRIAVIGAGFSGTLLAVQLLRRLGAADHIFLIERRAPFGRGLAYGTDNPHHLLNVPASNMSAFPDRPDHFVAWLRQVAPHLGPDSFVPRPLYGRYVQDILRDALAAEAGRQRLTLIPDEAVRIARADSGFCIDLEGGPRLLVDSAILALGNFPPQHGSGALCGNPWARDALSHLPRRSPVLVKGTGLTAVDVILSLLTRGHEGPILALSRHGHLPLVHYPALQQLAADPPWPSIHAAELETESLTLLLRHLRRAAAGAAAHGLSWQTVVDALRPHTQDLWHRLPDRERRRFLRHGKTLWDIHRHRMAPDIASRIEAARRDGQLTILAARIEHMAVSEDSVKVTLRRRGSPHAEQHEVARLIDCTGPAADLGHVASPLLQSLIASGLARPDALRLGLDVDGDNRLRDQSGDPVPGLCAVGPLTRAAHWEIMAVPDIRTQCATLAEMLLRPAIHR